MHSISIIIKAMHDCNEWTALIWLYYDNDIYLRNIMDTTQLR